MSDFQLPDKAIAITSGEPAGIGPDIIIQAAHQAPDLLAHCVVIGDKALFLQRADMLNLPITSQSGQPGALNIINHQCQTPVKTGELNANNSRYVIDCIEQATQGCLNNQYHAMVTAPVHKGIIQDAGINFSGHTEFIADICSIPKPVMMLADNTLKVCLATTHLPLRNVADAINAQTLWQVLNVMHHELKSRFGISHPHIGVCGLNPHAGENGHLGDEEINTIIPALEALRQQGLNLSGPLPADTIFVSHIASQFDAILAMYHDQGLPVIKQHGFGEVVNITLGLPIIRTSVDHGTALELAGSGKSNCASLIAAIEMAAKLQC